MDTFSAAERLGALGHETRLAIFRLLVETGPAGLAAGVIGERLALAPATLSFHLAHLSRVGLIAGRQAGRFIYYAADFSVMDDLLAFLTDNCCQGAACLPRIMPYRVLVLCTGNSARSILGEALLDHLGRQRPGRPLRAFSAGSRPAGQVNPVALETLVAHGVPLPRDEAPRSKSWDEFAAPGAPALDFIFTVCASAAGEACPVWPGRPATAHWGIADPAHVEPLAARRAAFETAFGQLERRVRAFLALPLETMSQAEVVAAARRIHADAEAAEQAAADCAAAAAGDGASTTAQGERQ